MPIQPILLVEDNPDDVEAVRRVAVQCRLSNPVFAVESAEQALWYLKGECLFSNRELYPMPVLILLDLVMPGVGGSAVLEWLKGQLNLEIPVIILTGMRDLRKMGEAYQMGARTFLMKPVEDHEFKDLIRSFKGIDIGV